MKKSKILFILAIVFVIITIGCLFYKNSCNQKNYELWEEHMADDIALKNGKITQAEFDKLQRQKSKSKESSDTADIIFSVAVGITVITLASGVVVLIIEKKKNR